MSTESKHDMATQAWQTVPSFAAIITYAAGVPIEKWAAFFGLLFIMMQMGYLGWKWWRDVRRERRREMLGEKIDDTGNSNL